MPRVVWSLFQRRPIIEVVLTQAADGQPVIRRLLADTGAGTTASKFELILEENDCLLCGGHPTAPTVLRGAYQGPSRVYVLRVRLPALGFDHPIRAAAAPVGLPGFDGLACFRFLNRFGYGNFGDPTQFGLES